jgi:hypothetical protein
MLINYLLSEFGIIMTKAKAESYFVENNYTADEYLMIAKKVIDELYKKLEKRYIHSAKDFFGENPTDFKHVCEICQLPMIQTDQNVVANTAGIHNGDLICYRCAKMEGLRSWVRLGATKTEDYGIEEKST